MGRNGYVRDKEGELGIRYWELGGNGSIGSNSGIG